MQFCHLKRIFILFIIFSSSLGRFGGAFAQIYPVQITTQLQPPFSGYIPDYATPGNQNLKLLVLFTDFSKPSYNIKLKIKISGQNINIQSKNYYYAGPFTVTPGIPIEISGSDLSALLNTNNLDFSGISAQQYNQQKILPEGFYNICFTAYDYNNSTPIQVSNESCAFGWMILSDPPFLNLPMCGSSTTSTNPQNIIFQWTPMNLTSPNSAMNTLYDFELFEIIPGSQNAGNILQTLPPIYKTTTSLTFVNYGITEPVLNIGMQYVWRVRARDITGRDLFKNQGYSAPCTFYYGNILSQIDSSSLKLNLKGSVVTHRVLQYSWDTISLFTSYKLEYRKLGGANWFPVSTSNNGTVVNNLEPQNTYEARVKGIFSDGEGPWSNTVTLTTPAKPIIQCGQGIASNLNNTPFKPLTTGKVGQIWDIGQFEMIVTQLDQPNNFSGTYSGYGKITIPFMLNMNLNGKFSNILVNEAMEVVQGKVEIVTEGQSGGNIIDLDSVLADIFDWYNQIQNSKDATNKNVPPHFGSLCSTSPLAELLTSCDAAGILNALQQPNGMQNLQNSTNQAAINLQLGNIACDFDATDKYFIAPNGKAFKMPAGAKVKYLSFGYNQTGVVYAFEKDKNIYKADMQFITKPNNIGDVDYYFDGYKYNTTKCPINFIGTAKDVHLLEKEGNTIKIYKIDNYSMPLNATNNKIEGTINNEHIISNQTNYDAKKLAFTCNIGTNNSAPTAIDLLFNKLKNKNLKGNTYVYQDGFLIKLQKDKPAEKVACSSAQLQELKTKIADGEFSEATAVLFEKKSTGYNVTVGYNKSVQAKYGNSTAVKQKCSDLLENRLNDYLKNTNDLTVNAENVNSSKFPDGKNISLKQLSFFDKVVTLVSETKEFIEEAQIQPKYYDSEDPEYANNWMSAPPLLAGVGNGVINEIKEIPQLVSMAADLAVNSETREKFATSLKNLSWDKVKSGVSNAAGSWANTYTEGGDKAWHQGGKDVVMVFSLFSGKKLLTGADDLIENQADDIAVAVEKKTDPPNVGMIVRGITKTDFFNSVPEFKNPANGLLGDQAWDLWKEQKWSELENLFNVNNINSKWPPNRGFIEFTIEPLSVGKEFDRYGGYIDNTDGLFKDNGLYASPKGASFESRALPADYLTTKPYKKYKVLKEIPGVKKGEAAPWFNQPGRGVQYEFPEGIDDLIKHGYIEEIN